MGLFRKKFKKNGDSVVTLIRYPYDVWAMKNSNSMETWEDNNIPYDALEWVRLFIDSDDTDFDQIEKVEYRLVDKDIIKASREKGTSMDDIMDGLSSEEIMRRLHTAGLDKCYSLYFLQLTFFLDKMCKAGTYTLRLEAKERDKLQSYLKTIFGDDVYVAREMLDAEKISENTNLLYRMADSYFDKGIDAKYISLADCEQDDEFNVADFYIPVFIKRKLTAPDFELSSLTGNEEKMLELFSELSVMEEFGPNDDSELTLMLKDYIENRFGSTEIFLVNPTLVPVRNLPDIHNEFCRAVKSYAEQRG